MAVGRIYGQYLSQFVYNFASLPYLTYFSISNYSKILLARQVSRQMT